MYVSFMVPLYKKKRDPAIEGKGLAKQLTANKTDGSCPCHDGFILKKTVSYFNATPL
jgi:hypothetical protein